ncbi:hypothetical protein J8F10_06385 [Gemmata sp. G18]|uniref:Uncharacterized protein n=1 Tax=Gemmata palustris TaxID=2822762 RepID=A0ABS5BMH0_9BACT|nr:hypothetical protein [Gemmata palustris]MBP3954907.1 hypothetical protein [Gemmata palustris]
MRNHRDYEDDEIDVELVQPRKRKRTGLKWLKIYAVCVCCVVLFVVVNALHGIQSRAIQRETERSRELHEQEMRLMEQDHDRVRKQFGIRK